MKLFIFVGLKPKGSIHKEKDRGIWIGIQRNYEEAKHYFKKAHPDKKGIFYCQMTLWEMRYLLPFLHGKQK